MLSKIKLEIDNGNIIDIFPKINSRSKNIKITVSCNKKIQLIIPSRISYKSALEFLLRNKIWVVNKLANMPENITITDGSKITILGEELYVHYTNELRGYTNIEGNQIKISGDAQLIFSKLVLFIKNMLKKEIEDYALKIADNLGVKYSKISIKDTTTRWGSCSSDGNLSFSWRLALSPRFVMQYVVVHEICHLVEFNHSKKFWDLVASVFPDYKTAIKFLKYNGKILHSYM